MGGPSLSRTPLGILAPLLLAVVPVFVPAAAAPRTSGDLTGRTIDATTAPDRSPRIGSGTYLVTLPRRRATYLRLDRTTPGTTFHVGGQLVGVGGSTGEGFDVELGTKPGSGDCGNAVVFRPTLDEHAPVLYAATSTWTSVAEDPCTANGTIYVKIAPPNERDDVGRPLQLRVYEEPPVDPSALDLLTTPSPPSWSALTPGPAQEIRPTHVVDTAPVVRNGTYGFRLRPGESEFLAVPLDWGAGLRVQVDAELPDGVSDPGVDVHVLGPLLDGADTGGLGADSSIGQTRDHNAWSTGVMVPDISYINRDSVDAAVNGADLAGVHYIAIGYRPSAAGARPLGVRLTVQVLPGDGQAPLYSDVSGVFQPEATSRLADGSLKAAPPPTAAQSAAADAVISEPGPPWGRIALIGAGLAAFGLVVIRLHDRSLRRKAANQQRRHRGERHAAHNQRSGRADHRGGRRH